MDLNDSANNINYNRTPCKATSFPNTPAAILDYLELGEEDAAEYSLSFEESSKLFLCQHRYLMRMMKLENTANTYFYYDSWDGRIYNYNE